MSIAPTVLTLAASIGLGHVLPAQDPDEITLLARNAFTGEPVPGAGLFIDSKQLIADEEGRVSVTRWNQYFKVWAAKDDLAGLSIFHGKASPGPVVVNLFPDQCIRVKVVDEAGNPVGGVPILVERVGKPEYGVRGPMLSDADTGIVDLSYLRAWGQDLLPDLQELEYLREMGLQAQDPSGQVRWPIFDESDQLRISFGFPAALRHGVILPLDRDLPDELSLRMPPTGKLLITADRGVPRLSMRMSEVDKLGDYMRSPKVTETDEGYLFEPIGVDLPLYMYLAEERSIDGAAERSLLGPSAAGETRRIHFETASKPSVLMGRLLLAADRSHVLQPIYLTRHVLSYDWRTVWNKRTHTDPESLFRFEFLPGPFGWENEVLQAALYFDDGEGHLLSWGLDLPWTELDEHYDLGTLSVATSEGLLVAGQVVDEGGEPVAGAELQLDYQDPQKDIWYQTGEFALRADAEGKFAIHGKGSELPLALSASADGYEGRGGILFPADGEELRIELHRVGGLGGSLELPELGLRQPPGLHVHQVAGDGKRRSARVDGTGMFLGKDFLVGTWSFELRATGSEVALMRWDEVVVESWEIARPAAMQGVSLEGRVWHAVCSIGPAREGEERARDDSSVRFYQARAYVLRDQRPPILAFDQSMKGWVTDSYALWFDSPRPDVLLHMGGLPPVVGRDVEGEFRVGVEPRPRVSLRLGEGVEVPEGYRAYVTLGFTGEGLESLGSEHAVAGGALDVGSVLGLAVSGVGEYRVDVELRGDGFPILRPAGVEPAVIVVAEGSPKAVELAVEGPFR